MNQENNSRINEIFSDDVNLLGKSLNTNKQHKEMDYFTESKKLFGVSV